MHRVIQPAILCRGNKRWVLKDHTYKCCSGRGERAVPLGKIDKEDSANCFPWHATVEFELNHSIVQDLDDIDCCTPKASDCSVSGIWRRPLHSYVTQLTILCSTPLRLTSVSTLTRFFIHLLHLVLHKLRWSTRRPLRSNWAISTDSRIGFSILSCFPLVSCASAYGWCGPAFINWDVLRMIFCGLSRSIWSFCTWLEGKALCHTLFLESSALEGWVWLRHWAFVWQRGRQSQCIEQSAPHVLNT